MTKDNILIEVNNREVVRKGLNKLRADGVVPAVIHQHGNESVLVQADRRDLTKLFDQAGRSTPVTVKVGSKDYLTLIRDVDYSPTKNQIRHMVFQAIRKGEKVHTEVHVSLTEGDSVAEKNGLMVLKQLDTVEVEAIPSKLPEAFVLDKSELAEIGDRLAVEDIDVPSGVTILTPGDAQIAIVEQPKDQLAEADAAAADLAADAESETEVPTTEQEEDVEVSEGGEEAAQEEGVADSDEESKE